MSIEETTLLIAYLFVGLKLLQFLKWVYSVFFRKRKNLAKEYGKGSFAVVTGSTDGIGKAFALSLAKEGFNIILVARNKEKLVQCQKEIAESTKVMVETIQFDFSKKVLLKDYEDLILKKVEGIDISILVNNVGCGEPLEFIETPLEDIHSITLVNMLPQAILTRHFIEQFSKRELKSAIIDVSSATALNPYPYHSTYASAKAFKDRLSQSLQLEIGRKIDMQLLRPFGVATNMIKVKKNIAVIDPSWVSEASLDRLGYDTICYGHWNHDIQGFFNNFVPQIVFNHMNFAKLFRFLRNIARKLN